MNLDNYKRIQYKYELIVLIYMLQPRLCVHICLTRFANLD
jgi:hypothetical protein